jgi:hypothetical protein
MRMGHDVYYSQSIIRMVNSKRMRWARYIARKEAMRNTYRLLVGKLEGKKPLRRLR